MDNTPPSADPVTYHQWPQHLAQTVLATVLRAHLPHSNPLYNRILAPQNTPSRHCLFAATFPPPGPPQSSAAPFTILFSDRSRHHEAQIWLFNPLTTFPPSAAHSTTLTSHITSALHFIRATPIPAAPGWPFSAQLKLASLPTAVADAITTLTLPSRGAVVRDTDWTHYAIPLAGDRSSPPLPAGFTSAPVPDSQLDVVISTSGIPRQAETLRTLPCSAILDADGRLAAWAYVDLAGSLATLYVLPEHRGRGFARAVAGDLLGKLHRGEFGDLGRGTAGVGGDKSLMPFGQGSGWVSAEVKEGNRGSEKVVEWLGGRRYGNTRYMFIESDLLP